MKIRELTCIVCPRGCALKVELDETGAPVSVSGNLCKRGEAYANDECVRPMRVVTSTVACEGGGVVSCKTSTAVPKGLVFEVMRMINGVTAPAHVKIGDVIISNVLDTGADVVATSNK
ncbi:MAG: DUF1667 domain-containing protein [Clostridia bacterium]|nr:DUF1667 domain-containing protein [Clostridia bacterium]